MRFVEAIIAMYCKVRFMFIKKNEDLIPEGYYCYKAKTLTEREITPCFYYRRVGKFNWCAFENSTDFLLDDMVKICFVKED